MEMVNKRSSTTLLYTELDEQNAIDRGIIITKCNCYLMPTLMNAQKIWGERVNIIMKKLYNPSFVTIFESKNINCSLLRIHYDLQTCFAKHEFKIIKGAA